MKIEILGMGCLKCKKLFSNAQTAVKELNIQAEVSKVEDINKIIEYGAFMTPALAIDGEVKVSGRMPSVGEIKNILQGRLGG